MLPKDAHVEAIEILRGLPPLEQLVLRLRFSLGLTEPTRYSYVQIAESMGCNVAKVKQIEASALRMLRHPSRAQNIGRFIGDKTPDDLAIQPVIETVRALTPELIKHLQTHHDDVERVPWKVFEHLIAEFLKQRGCDEVRLVGQCPDTAADIYAFTMDTKTGTPTRHLIQVKQWRDKVGIEVIHQVAGAMFLERPRHGWTASMIVSMVGFKDFHSYTPWELSRLQVELKARDDLMDWLKGYVPNEDGLWLPAPLRTMTAAQ